MKRRTFVNIFGGASTGLIISPNIVSSVFLQDKTQAFTPEELKTALEEYYWKIFDSSLNAETLAPEGRYFFADSFEIEVNSAKNDVFDFAEFIIEQARSLGFDASVLKEGKIPNGMQVINDGITIFTEKGMTIFKVEGLKNWDASIIYNNCINIMAKVPPCLWNKLDKIQPLIRGRGFEGNLSGPFKIYLSDNQTKRLNIERIAPSIRFINKTEEITILNSKILSQFFSENVIEKLI
jgi:hypothetical protein